MTGPVSGTLQAKASGGWSLNAMPLVFQRRYYERGEGVTPSPIVSALTVENRSGDSANWVAFDWQHSMAGRRGNIVRQGGLSGTLGVTRQDAVYSGMRRLTPVECERLQGFPDGWTEWGIDEKGHRVEMSDTARYTQLGNAVAVPVVDFIVRRLNGFLDDDEK